MTNKENGVEKNEEKKEEILEEDNFNEENLKENNLEEESLQEDYNKEMEKEIEELKNSLLRLQADFSNFRNRVEKEKQDTINYATESIICELLPVLDNFQRALSEVEEDGFYHGVKMIYDQLFKILHDKGLKEIRSNGEKFDPNYHYAVLLEDDPEFEEGVITDTIEKGYILNDKVIRPSMVKVAK